MANNEILTYNANDFGMWSEEQFNERLNTIKIVSGLKSNRGINNRLINDYKEYEHIANLPKVKAITIEMSWYNNRTWGYCPQTEWWAVFEDGSMRKGKTPSVTGCGYDKCSQALSYVFNDVAQSLAYSINKENPNKEKPYGLYFSYGSPAHFDGGIGEECYIGGIAKYLGMKCEHTGGKKFDFYRFTRQ